MSLTNQNTLLLAMTIGIIEEQNGFLLHGNNLET
jgi:hypothetical protein